MRLYLINLMVVLVLVVVTVGLGTMTLNAQETKPSSPSIFESVPHVAFVGTPHYAGAQ